MTHHIRAERRIPVPADLLWNTVSQMTGMEDWYPGLIARSDLTQRAGQEPQRRCVMQDGGVLEERVLLRDADTRTFVYAIDSHPMPAGNVVGTIRIDDLEDGQSHVSWAADMVLDPKAGPQFAEMVRGMYADGLASLERFHTV